MIGWLIYEKKSAEKNRAYIRMHEEEGRKLGITFRVLYTEEIEYGIKDGTWFIHYEGKSIEKPDFVINRSITPLLSKQLEFMNYPLFNDAKVAEICNDKAKTYQFAASLGIPMLDTSFVKNEEITKVLEREKELKVVKAVAGHGGSQVCLYDPAKGQEAIDQIMKTMDGSDVVIQQYYPGRLQDLRVYVIGKKIIGTVLRHAKSGFRSNYSLGGEVCPYELSDQEKQLVERICDAFDFGLVGIDFLIALDGTLIFNEIEDVVGARMLYATSDVNLVGEYLQYIIRNIYL